MKDYFFGQSGCGQTGPIIDFVTLVKLVCSGHTAILSDLAKATVKHVDEVLKAQNGITSTLFCY